MLLQLTLHSHLKEQEKAGSVFTLVFNALIGALKICDDPAEPSVVDLYLLFRFTHNELINNQKFEKETWVHSVM